MNQGHATSDHIAIITILVTSIITTGTRLHVLQHMTTVMDKRPTTATHANAGTTRPLSSARPRVNFLEDVELASDAGSDEENPISKDRKKVTEIFDGGH